MHELTTSFLNCNREILHDGIRQKFLTDFLRDPLCFVFGVRIDIHLNVLPDADVPDLGVPQRMNPVFNGFPLRIQN